MRLGSIVLAALVAGACSDALERDTAAGLVIAVVNSGSNSLSFVSATSFTSGPITDLTPPTGTPTTLDARGSLILVPMGTVNALRVYSFGTLIGPDIIALSLSWIVLIFPALQRLRLLFIIPGKKLML